MWYSSDYLRESIIFARRRDLGRRKGGNIWRGNLDLDDRAGSSQSRGDREAITHGGRIYAVSRQRSNICGREQIFLCHSREPPFFFYRHSSRADRTLTLRELSVLEEHQKTAHTFMYTVISHEIRRGKRGNLTLHFVFLCNFCIF